MTLTGGPDSIVLLVVALRRAVHGILRSLGRGCHAPYLPAELAPCGCLRHLLIPSAVVSHCSHSWGGPRSTVLEQRIRATLSSKSQGPTAPSFKLFCSLWHHALGLWCAWQSWRPLFTFGVILLLSWQTALGFPLPKLKVFFQKIIWLYFWFSLLNIFWNLFTLPGCTFSKSLFFASLWCHKRFKIFIYLFL